MWQNQSFNKKFGNQLFPFIKSFSIIGAKSNRGLPKMELYLYDFALLQHKIYRMVCSLYFIET